MGWPQKFRKDTLERRQKVTNSAPPGWKPAGKYAQYAIQTHLKGKYLTAMDGGGRITDVIHTNAVKPLNWETFTLWTDSARENYAFQTVNGYFVTAVNAGGMTSDAIHTNATQILGWEMFKLVPPLGQSASDTYAIQTQRGFFLTAVGGGGHDSGETIHTDAVTAREWELYRLINLDLIEEG